MIEVDDPTTAARLAYVANSVAQEAVPVRATLRWHVEGGGPWQLSEEGDPVDGFDRFDDLLYVLYQRVYGRLADHLGLAGWLSLHGGLVTLGGRRLMVLGEKGAGKTTLLLRLLVDGEAVEGDEMVLARDGLAVALPRRLHVKPGTAALVPEAAEALERSPRTYIDDGTPVVALDPAALGRSVATAPGRVDAAVLLRAAHQRPSRLEPVATVDLVSQVVAHTQPPSDSRRALFSALAALLGQADGYLLDVGPLDEAVTLLHQAASR